MSSKKKFQLFVLTALTLFISYKVIDLRLYKLALNEARLIPKTEATIFSNGNKLDNSYVFKYSDEDSKKIIVYLENFLPFGERTILIIDEVENILGHPNSTVRDYSMWGKYLFQNNSGERFIPFKSSDKRTYYDPKLIIKNDEVSFNLPKSESYDFKKIVIKF